MLKLDFHKNNDLTFQIKNKNGATIFNSISFTNEDELRNTLSSINNTNNKMKLIERKTNHEGLFLFNLKNDLGQIIGTSEHYNSEAGMENGIKNMINSL